MKYEPDHVLDEQDEAPLLLVVEDDADLLMVTVAELEDHYQVIQAVNGQDGLEKAMEYIPDLVVTDLMMPVLDGVSLCRELKSNQATSHIPVIMLTAKTAVESQIEGLEVGADDYITKPFHMVLLQARIHNLLESRRLLRERFSRDFSLSAPTLSGQSLDQLFLNKAAEVLEQHLEDPEFDHESFAQLLNMSLRSLQRKLKALIDRTPNMLLIEMRMKKAAQYLAETDLHVSEISFKTGYYDTRKFNRHFKTEFGQSPSQFRIEEPFDSSSAS